MSNNKFIPVAIVIAGIVIAGAVFYSGSSTAPTDDNDAPEDNGEIVVPPLTEDDHILGNPNAQLVIVEYSDIDCPFCSQFHVTMHRIIDEYGASGDVAWAYRHFPLAQLHPMAPAKAEASECVNELGGNDAFWSFLDALFEQEGESLEDLSAIAVSSAGVDATEFEACVADDRHQEKVEEQYNEAFAAGGTGTPYSIVVARTGQLVPINGAQPYENVKATIDALLGEL